MRIEKENKEEIPFTFNCYNFPIGTVGILDDSLFVVINWNDDNDLADVLVFGDYDLAPGVEIFNKDDCEAYYKVKIEKLTYSLVG